MEDVVVIVEELKQADKWLGSEYKNSIYYRDYLSKVTIDLTRMMGELTKESYNQIN